MSTLTWYRQARADGGVRTGVDADGAAILEEFQPGNEDFDPVLLWFVDLRCEGDALPTDPDSVRQWLRDHGPELRAAMRSAADELEVGFDREFRPLERPIVLGTPRVNCRLVVSAMRRIDGRQVAQHMRSIESDWDQSLSRLTPLASV